MAALKRVEAGLPVPEICRELVISTADVLQVASQVWRHGHLHDDAHERARRRD
jgi:hypothetical protein